MPDPPRKRRQEGNDARADVSKDERDEEATNIRQDNKNKAYNRSPPTQPIAASPTTLHACRELSACTMSDVFGLSAREWQLDVLTHLHSMTCKTGPHPAPVFLCQPTGGGKSLFRDTFACSNGGITINVAPLLSLSADQHSKFMRKKTSQQVFSIHLDTYRSSAQQQQLIELLSSQHPSSTTSIVVFCSPQCLVNHPPYQLLVKTLIKNRTLRQVCIDEVHLFAQFGLWFRSEFIDLRNALFNSLRPTRSCRTATSGGATSSTNPRTTATVVPVVFMTATCDQVILNQLQNMTGLFFESSNIFWPDVHGMQQRRQCIEYVPSPMGLKNVKARLPPLYQSSERKQWILYSNSRFRLEKAYEQLQQFLDSTDLPGDVILIVGTQSKEVKFHRTGLFLDQQHEDQSTTLDYDPIGCLTTRSLGAAGWDDPRIHAVFSLDFPTDLLSISQEKGRAGRRLDASPATDKYHVSASLESVVYLLHRILRSDTTISKDDYAAFDQQLPRAEYQELQLQQLHDVLDLFVLPFECQHCTLERRLANPNTPQSLMPLEPCRVACQFCIDGGIHPRFPRIIVAGVRQALLDLFLGDAQLTMPVLDKDLVEALRSYPNAQRQFFGAPRATKPPLRADINLLVLMLITARILTYRLVEQTVDAENEQATSSSTGTAFRPIIAVVAKLALTPDNLPALFDEARWNRLPQKVVPP